MSGTIAGRVPLEESMHPKTLMLVTGLALSAGALTAQTATPPASHPRGTFSYNVLGIYQGETMAPWESEITVADSSAGGVELLVVGYRSRRDDTGFRYEYRMALDTATGEFVVSQRNRGREPGSYELSVRGGRIRGPITAGGTTRTLDTTVAMPAIPAFALGPVLASRALRVGDTIAIGAMPLASGVGLERVRRFTGVVRDGELTRFLEKSPEPVWVVTGAAEYPAEFWIAKRDRMVLKAVIPQGTDGRMTEEFAGVGWK